MKLLPSCLPTIKLVPFRKVLFFFKYSFGVVFVVFFFSVDVISQNLNEMRFELLDEEDGLSNIIITHLALDSSGFLWIGTLNGLNRYDGHSFKVFRHNDKDSTSLLHDKGQHIYVDKKRRIWVSYREGGISVFNEDCQCFKHIRFPEDVKKEFNGGTDIFYIDKSDLIWFSGIGIGLNSFDPDKNKLVQYDLPKINTGHFKINDLIRNSINTLHVDTNGLFWICTDYGLFSFDLSTKQFSYKTFTIESPKLSYDDYFVDLFPEGETGYWLAANGGGIVHYDKATGVFRTYKYNKKDITESLGNIVSGFYPKSENELWITTDDRGLGVFNTLSKEFKFLDNMTMLKGKISAVAVKYLLGTPDKVMFLACDDGLIKFNPNASLFTFHPLSIEKKQLGFGFRFSNIIEDPDFHSIYFATDFGNGLTIQDTKTGNLVNLPVEINPNTDDKIMHVYDLLHDKRGRLWVLSADYFYEYDKIKKKLIRIPFPFTLKEIKNQPKFKSISEDREGTIWIITEQGGLYKFIPEGYKFSEQLNLRTLDSNAITKVERVVFDSHGTLWLQGDNKICTYNKLTNQFKNALPTDFNGVIDGIVNGMAADSLGNVWIVISNKGLLKIDTKNPESCSYKMITTADGLPTNRIYNMNADPYGNIWLATILGVVYLNTTTNAYRVFNQAVGMDKSFWAMKFKCAGGNSFYITSKERYCRVNFEDLNKKMSIPKIYIDKFRIFNVEKPVLLKNNTPISLKPGEDFFSFDFGCIDFKNQAHNKFAYMLEGWDKDWIQSDNRRYASYTNLNGRQYIFKVKVSNGEGIWGDPIQVPILVNTYFYKKSWFIVMLALFFAGMIYGLYQYRIQQIEKAEYLKTEFNKQLTESRMEALRAQMNPHFIFNCLNSINRYIIKSDIKTSSMYVTRFAKLMRLILDNSEHKKVVLANELEALKLYIEMEALRFDHKFTFEIEVNDDVDTSNIEVPPLIIQPYVENAIWHGLLQKDSGGNLIIKVSQLDETLICEITDNGIGREKAKEFKSKNAPTRKSIGMKLTEERLNMASEDLSISGSQKIIDLYDENGSPAGTTVIITIPI